MLLGPLMNERNINVANPQEGKNDDTFYRFRTISHPYFTELRNVCYQEGFYPDGSALKRVDELLLQYLTPEAIALWYFDDGFCMGHEKDTVGFSTDGFHVDDLKMLSAYLQSKYGIQTYLKASGKCKLITGYHLIIHDHSMEKFENLILPYTIKCMRHKFPEHYVVPPWDSDPEYV